MCTVIVRVPAAADEPVRMLAVRDEDPARPWQPLGEWWPEQPEVIGVRDVRAGGAWLAADAADGTLAVLLNRESPPVPEGMTQISRGGIVLDAVAGRLPHPTPAVLGFNLVTVDEAGVRVMMWDGASVRTVPVPPGTHMIAHHDLDDVRSPRIVAWRDAFAAADADEWMSVLERSAQLEPSDDRAIIRDNNAHGYPTQSLLLCTALVGPSGVDVRYAELARPGQWNPVRLAGPVAPA
ncbi:hypothetical protein ET475_09180 [Microbacterium protaetiae]|uniref:NRDE family protein n=1 Tax=Microbacterium protaetiae TaxID=2509458 RepID=A0A4P6EEF0_9MICO|nr:NRDE family protein [Microbacterium protaetiae]QAY60146.1 hypothetical protein ET475_09180 [Microbacterium protaetiae]